jgi:hypothetical protein
VTAVMPGVSLYQFCPLAPTMIVPSVSRTINLTPGPGNRFFNGVQLGARTSPAEIRNKSARGSRGNTARRLAVNCNCPLNANQDLEQLHCRYLQKREINFLKGPAGQL